MNTKSTSSADKSGSLFTGRGGRLTCTAGFIGEKGGGGEIEGFRLGDEAGGEEGIGVGRTSPSNIAPVAPLAVLCASPSVRENLFEYIPNADLRAPDSAVNERGTTGSFRG